MACPVRFVWLCVATGFVLWSCFVLTASAQPEKVPYRLYTTTDGLPDEEVGALAQTPDGQLWIGTRTGLAVFDGRRFHPVVFPDSLGLISVVDIVPRPDGSVWVASTNGAMQVRHGRLIRAELAGEAVSRILAHGDTLHFVTRRTLWTLSPGAPGLHALPFHYPIAGAPALLSTSSGGTGAIDADLDPAGSIWVLDGGFGPGCVQPDGSVDFVEGPQGRQGHLWNSLRFMQNGQALATQENRAVYHFDPASQALTLLLRNDTVSQVYGERGIGYVISNEGVLRWDVQAQRWLAPLGTALGLPTNFMRSVLRDRERSLWMGTSSGLLHLFAPDVRHLQALGGSGLYYVGNLATGQFYK